MRTQQEQRETLESNFYESLKAFRATWPQFVVYGIYPSDFERFNEESISDEQLKCLVDGYHNGEGLTIAVNEFLNDTVQDEMEEVRLSYSNY